MPLFGWRRRYWTFLLKLAKSRPSWTIQAQPGPAVGPFHWSNRRLSVRALCRLQTFPDDVNIVGGRGSAQKQLGNAVPSLLAEVMGRAIREQLLDCPNRNVSLKLLPQRRTPTPPPEPIAKVPRRFRQLAGEHSPHPGVGPVRARHLAVSNWRNASLRVVEDALVVTRPPAQPTLWTQAVPCTSCAAPVPRLA
jgi:DNA (cytosine-5)-methyltransferase 1